MIHFQEAGGALTSPATSKEDKQMKTLLIACTLLIAFFAFAPETEAQTKVNVRFARGKTTGSYNGSIRGQRYMDYVLRARAGQTLRVVLTKRSGAPVYFNVLPSGSEVAIADDARQSTSWLGELPNDGAYPVRVYMEKGDRQNNRSSSYNVRFSIEVE